MKPSLNRRVIILIACLGMISGLVPVLDVPAGAQGRPGDSGFTAPGLDNRPDRNITPGADRTVPPTPGEGSGVEVSVVDRRTVRSDIVPDLDAAFADVAPIESVDGSTGLEVAPTYDGPAGFIEGGSTWVESASTELKQVFANPDGTTTVFHSASPATVADDGYSIEFVEAPGLSENPGRGFGRSNGDEEITVPDVAKADEVLAEITSGDAVVSIRPGRRDFEVAGGAEDDKLADPPAPGEASDDTPRNPVDDSEPDAEERGRPDTTPAAESRGREDADSPGVIRFDDLVDSVDVEVSAFNGGIKLDYIVDSAADATGLVETIDFPAGWTVKAFDGLIELVDEEGERAGLWTGGDAWDASERKPGERAPSQVTLELIETTASSATARLVVDEAWLNAESTLYPVRLDPVVYLNQGVQQDVWVGADGSKGALNDVNLLAGFDNSSERHSFLEFGLNFGSEFAAGPNVQSATLAMGSGSAGLCGNYTLNARRVIEEWDQVSIQWTQSPGRPNNTTTGQSSVTFHNCNQPTFTMDLTDITQHWMANPGSNHGLVLFSNAGSPHFSVTSRETTVPPVLVITYDLPTHLASYGPIGELNGEPQEARLPRPGGANHDLTKFGSFPLNVQNQGWMDWNTGAQLGHPSWPTGQVVNLSYHADSNIDPVAAAQGGWDQPDGARTELTATSSLMYSYWNYVMNGGPAVSNNPQLLLAAAISNRDYATAGVRYVFFDMVHEGQTWFQGAGSPLSAPEPIRWTDPPTISAPAQGSVFSALEDVTVSWARPHDGLAGEWTPSDYRLRFLNGGVEVHEVELAGTTTSYTVPDTVDLGVGTITWTIEARDGANESTGDPQKWTHPEPSAIAINALSLGANPLADQFGGVDPATGNFYTAITDMSIPSLASGLAVTRHFNSQNLNAGMFGPGITTNLEFSFDCATSGCDATTGSRLLRRADGTELLFRNDGSGNYSPADGSNVEGRRIANGSNISFELAYPDGTIQRFAAAGITDPEIHGDYAALVSPEGHLLAIATSSSSGLPTLVTDVASGRSIKIEYDSFYPYTSSDVRVSKISAVIQGSGAYEEVNYLYTLSWELSSATNDLPAVWTSTWHPSGQLDRLTWPSNGRYIDLAYNADGTVDTVTNGETDVMDFDYDFATNVTDITDARGNPWKIEFEERNRTAVLTPPGGAGFETTYSYLNSTNEVSPYRTLIVDANGNEASLLYGEDPNNDYTYGNLLERTNNLGETTYYRYDSNNYDSVDHVSGPSHVCDTRSANATDNTYCTVMTYDGFGNKLTEQQPGELATQAEQWVYTIGSGPEVTIDGGTSPAGLLRFHRTPTVGSIVGVTEYRYDSEGDLRWMQDANGLITEYDHDDLGRVLTETIEYTDNGAPESETIATHTYDNAGRLATTTGPTITNPVTGQLDRYQVVYTTDANGNVTKKEEQDIVNPDPGSGREWDYEYDAMDRLVKSWDPEALTASPMRYEYDGSGNQISVTDYNDNEVETTYDIRNNPDLTTAIDFEDGHGVTANRTLVDRSHDDAGRLTSVKTYTASGTYILETYGYDTADRQTSITRTEDGVATIVSESIYDADGFLQTTKSGDTSATPGQDLAVTTYTYYDDGRVKTETIDDGTPGTTNRSTTYVYDFAGNVLTVTSAGDDPLSTIDTTHLVTNEYDLASNLIKVTTDNGTNDIVTRFDYDERGLLVEETDPNLNITTHRFDALGRRIQTTAPSVAWEAASTMSNIESNWTTANTAPVTNLGYNNFGDTTHVEDPNGNITETSYDTNGRRTRVDHPDATQPNGTTLTGVYEEWEYDDNGNTTSYRSRNANTTDYEFDDANRPVIQRDPLLLSPDETPAAARGEHETHYDWAGRPTKTVDPTGATITMSYNDRGWLKKTTQVIRAVPNQAAMTAEVTNNYSGQGFVTSTVDSQGATSSSTYNAYGETLSAAIGTGTEQLDDATTLYDGVGRVRQATARSGEYSITSYDGAGRTSTIAEYDNTDTAIRTLEQKYDDNGNLTETTSGRGGTTVYTFDDLNRLTGVVIDVDDTNTVSYGYGYDLNGNSTRFTDGNNNITRTTYNSWDLPTHLLEPSATTSPTEAETARLFRTYYNNGGQPVEEHQPGVRVRIIEYNTLGLPDNETTSQLGQTTVGRTMTYDLNGRVIQTSHPTAPINFGYDDRGLLVTQTGGAGDTTTTYDTAGRPDVQTDEAGSRQYAYETSTGHLNSVTDGTATGGGSGSVNLDVLLLVNNPASLQNTEQRINDQFVADGHTVTLRDAGDPEIAWTGVIVIADTAGLGSKYQAATTPIVDLIPWHFDDLGMTTGPENAIAWEDEMTIVLPTHPLAAGNTGTTQILQSSHGMAYHDSTKFGAAQPALVADLASTPGWRVLMGYTNNQTLADNTSAPEARVGISGFHGSNAIPTTAGYDLLEAALQWANDPNYTSGGGAPTGSEWSETYVYDDAGRLETTTYSGGGVRTVGYDDAGRMDSDVVTSGATVTAATTYVYSCDHELIEKNITALDSNAGADRNTYTYDHAGRLTSWDDGATATPEVCPTTGSGGGGTGTAALDVLLLVNNPASLQNTEQRINDEFVADGHTVTLRDAGDPEIAWTGVIVIADTAGLGSKYQAATTPIVDLIPWHFDDLGMTTGPENAIAWEDEMTIVLPTHPLAAGNTGTTQILQSSHGMAYHDSTKFGAAQPALVADLASTPGWRVLMGYTNNQTLADNTSAPEARVGISGFHGSNAIPTTAGYDLLEAALQWANDPLGGSGGSSGSSWTPSGEIYTYDNAGNRLTAGTETFTYDNRNRLETDADGSYAWNTDGTLDTYTPNTGPVEDYTFDAAGRLTDITDGTNTTDYTYDSLDRIAERDGSAFTYNGGQWDPTSDGTDTFHRSTGGSLLAYDDGTNVNHAVGNNHYDLTALVAADGTVSDTATYDPWGDPIATTGTTNPVLGYQSDYTDPDTDKVWMGTRWYQPNSGTFLSRDTYAGELSTPFTLNRYTYATNNPMSFWDPDGRMINSVDGLGFGENLAARDDQTPVYDDLYYDYSTQSWKDNSSVPSEILAIEDGVTSRRPAEPVPAIATATGAVPAAVLANHAATRYQQLIEDLAARRNAPEFDNDKTYTDGSYRLEFSDIIVDFDYNGTDVPGLGLPTNEAFFIGKGFRSSLSGNNPLGTQLTNEVLSESGIGPSRGNFGFSTWSYSSVDTALLVVPFNHPNGGTAYHVYSGQLYATQTTFDIGLDLVAISLRGGKPDDTNVWGVEFNPTLANVGTGSYELNFEDFQYNGVATSFRPASTVARFAMETATDANITLGVGYFDSVSGLGGELR